MVARKFAVAISMVFARSVSKGRRVCIRPYIIRFYGPPGSAPARLFTRTCCENGREKRCG